ncbi:MAG: hypothetical protein AAFX93_00015 [Verrucomicrobiota bacterium]
MSDTPRTDKARDYTAPEKLDRLCSELERENAELRKKVDIAKEAIAQLSDELKELHEDSEGDAEQILMLTQRVETLTRENEKLQEGGGE